MSVPTVKPCTHSIQQTSDIKRPHPLQCSELTQDTAKTRGNISGLSLQIVARESRDLGMYILTCKRTERWLCQERERGLSEGCREHGELSSLETLKSFKACPPVLEGPHPAIV